MTIAVLALAALNVAVTAIAIYANRRNRREADRLRRMAVALEERERGIDAWFDDFRRLAAKQASR